MERTRSFFQNYSATQETEQEREPYDTENATVSEAGSRTRIVMESTNIEPEINSQGYAIYRKNLKKTVDCGVKKQTCILIIICLQFLITAGVVIFLAIFRKLFKFDLNYVV